MDTVTVGMLGTVAGIGFIGTIIEEVLLRAAKLPGETKDRFGPVLAVLIGVILGVVGQLSGVAGGGDIVLGILTGVVAGGTSMGIHDIVSGTIAPSSGGG